MKLNHLNLITDVRAASEFPGDALRRANHCGNAGMRFLTDAEDGWGFVLTLQAGSAWSSEHDPVQWAGVAAVAEAATPSARATRRLAPRSRRRTSSPSRRSGARS
jgi:hypothetical protein